MGLTILLYSLIEASVQFGFSIIGLLVQKNLNLIKKLFNGQKARKAKILITKDPAEAV